VGQRTDAAARQAQGEHRMNPRRHAHATLTAILAAAILCAATGASAQKVYKMVDAGERVTFTDQPGLSPELELAPEPETLRQPKRIAGISSPRAAAAVDASESARRLRQAQLKRFEGMEPMPGELTSGVPNNRYWQRQEKLRRLVEMAQRRQQETTQPKLSSR
jgi:hypothetical protein